MPNIEDILPELAHAKVFTKVECHNGYWQIKLDKESSLAGTNGSGCLSEFLQQEKFFRYAWMKQ